MVQQKGFTLIELQVVIATVTLLVVMFVPALAGTRQNTLGIECLANQKRLAAGWLMYAGDNQDRTAGLYHDGSAPGTIIQWSTNWCGGLMSDAQSCTNTLPLTAGELYPYIKNLNAYRCPADNTTQHYVWAGGGNTLRVRSYSMSDTFGQGAWLPSSRYRTYNRLGNIVHPSQTLVFIDEAPQSINDAAFSVQMTPAGRSSATEISFPAGRHGGAAGISFADGHSLIQRWESPLTYSSTGGLTSSDPAFVEDMVWLSSVSSVPK